VIAPAIKPPSPMNLLGIRDHTEGPGGSLHTFSPERKYGIFPFCGRLITAPTFLPEQERDPRSAYCNNLKHKKDVPFGTSFVGFLGVRLSTFRHPVQRLP